MKLASILSYISDVTPVTFHAINEVDLAGAILHGVVGLFFFVRFYMPSSNNLAAVFASIWSTTTAELWLVGL